MAIIVGKQECKATENPFSLRVGLAGRDQIEISGVQGVGVPKVQLKGCTQLMDLMKSMRAEHGEELRQWPGVEGSSHSEILLRELQLKLHGQWNFPFKEEYVCNCRHVA